MDLILLFFIICIFCRIKIFKDRQQKTWKALIPCYNKYAFGILADTKKIGIITSIFNLAWLIFLFVNIQIETLILNKIPDTITDTITDTKGFDISDYVSQNLLISNYILKGCLIVSLLGYLICWIILTYKFSQKQESNTWWMLAWGVIPVVAYLYYAIFYKTMYIPGTGIVQKQVKLVKKEKEIVNVDNNRKNKARNKK